MPPVISAVAKTMATVNKIGHVITAGETNRLSLFNVRSRMAMPRLNNTKICATGGLPGRKKQ